ncbi:hypothetical protein IFM89_005636 [Coptis chinensis]|uniref:RRM domain-containing protein n=1 Tax=Coptis chinensis TaxID=261450 RepID=A0A835IVB3_9MAGN|nr:hypothetical protein IFM89_005636 [Coptis chinensis]
MGNKKKSNSSSSSLPEQQNDSSPSDDIFKSLFGAQAPESQGLGLHLTPIPKNTEQESNKKKREKSNLEEDKSEKTKRKKADVFDNKEIIEEKKKRKREVIEEVYEAKAYNADVEIIISKKKVGEKRKSKDDVISKEEQGYDDEDKLLRTVFVGNLPLKVKKKVLLKEFSKFGDVESVRIRSVPIVDSKTPRKGAIMKGKINESVDSVHAYIVFKDEKSAQASLSHNMAMLGGNHIRVDNACPPRKKLKADSAPVYDNKRTVFVGNLPFDVKDEEIYQLLCGIKQIESDIEGVRVIRDPNSSVGKGIAYVLFKTMV